MIARRLLISGRVQRVHYRDSMIAVARGAGTTGWVRNRRDGDVEAFVQGAPDAVQRVVDWAWQGPPAARVERVEADERPLDRSLVGFELRATV